MASIYRETWKCLTIILYVSHLHTKVNGDFWTTWQSNDGDDGIGDIEPCAATMCLPGTIPLEIEARPIAGGWTISAEQLIEVGPTLGLRCINDMQQGDETCCDYEVRYFIGDSTWKNKDKPVIKASAGDFEIPGNLCKSAEGMAFRKAGTTGSANRAYENVKIGPDFGFECLHDNQPDGICQDYEVRFLCPSSTLP